MKRDIRILRLLLAAFTFMFGLCTARAEVTKVTISSRQDVLGGKTFGTVGAYEKLAGKIYFAIDPKDAHNKIIADLDKSPRNARGMVGILVGRLVVRPQGPSKGNGVV